MCSCRTHSKQSSHLSQHAPRANGQTDNKHPKVYRIPVYICTERLHKSSVNPNLDSEYQVNLNMFPSTSYVVAHAVPREFVMPVISFTLSAVVAWTFLSESSPEDMADTKHARTTAIYSLANCIGQMTDMNVHPTFSSHVPLPSLSCLKAFLLPVASTP